METIPDSVLDRPVTGVNLVPGRLRDQLGSERMLLVFLRHFGCIFCKETVADLRGIAERDDSFPKVLFFSQGSSTESRAFLRRYWPEARVVSDPEFEFYDAFGVGRASVIKALGPSVLRARFRASAKGHENGARSGDIWRMPGVFVVEGARVLWAHRPRHAADHPDFAQLAGSLPAPA